MNTNALNKLSYGLYILSSKKKDKASGCIIDACIQAGSDPNQILISVMNSNFTRKIIEKSGVFCLAILEESCPFELIKHFGYQSSSDVDKFEGLTTFTDINGVPCVLSYTCGSISVKVTDKIDIGSHTIFIGKVKDQKCLSKNKPLTYAYYRENIMPSPTEDGAGATGLKPNFVMYSSIREYHIDGSPLGESDDDKKIKAWRCTICGSIYNDSVLPNDYMCTVCGHPSSDFVPIYE